MKKAKKKEILLSPTQLAKKLGIKLFNIYRWREENWIPLDEVREGKKIFWVWDPERFFKSQTIVAKHAEILELLEADLMNVCRTIRRIRKEQRDRTVKFMLPMAGLEKDAKK